jgi:hypothetical protein
MILYCLSGSQTCFHILSHLLVFALHTFGLRKSMMLSGPAVPPPGSLSTCFRGGLAPCPAYVFMATLSCWGGVSCTSATIHHQLPYLSEALQHVLEVHVQQVAPPRQWHRAWWVVDSVGAGASGPPGAG